MNQIVEGSAFGQIAFQPLGSARRLSFLPQACLSLRLWQHACERCVAACPVAALKLDDSGMSLGEGCMGCGRCTSVCPSTALRVKGFEAPPSALEGEVVVECWKVVSQKHGKQPSVKVPCLGGLSGFALLELVAAAQGHSVRLMDRGWCASCAAGGGEVHPAAAAVKEVEKILTKLGAPAAWLPQIVLAPLPSDLMPEDIPDPLSQQPLNRRGFFSAFLSEATATLVSAASGAGKVGAAPRTLSLAAVAGRETKKIAALIMALAQRAGTEPSAALFPSVELGTACCNHGICAAACPSGALLRHEDDAASGILFDPTACFACGICVGVCPEHAVRLLPEGNPAHAIYPVELHHLAHRSCSECGEKFTGKSASQVCPDCAKRCAMGASLFGIGSADSRSSATEAQQ